VRPFADVPIPVRMQALERDKRGYPIPVIVLRDLQGRPHFTINDQEKVQAVTRGERCAICGYGLGAIKWFAGGPGSAFAQQGCYLDGPMHRDCVEYAMQVCPYLALAGSYRRRIEGSTLRREDLPPHVERLLVDHTVTPDQPAVFITGATRRYTIGRNGYFHPERPWLEVKFWRDGGTLNEHDAFSYIAGDPKLPVPLERLDAYWPRPPTVGRRDNARVC
jgi:hypothetical protein